MEECPRAVRTRRLYHPARDEAGGLAGPAPAPVQVRQPQDQVDHGRPLRPLVQPSPAPSSQLMQQFISLVGGRREMNYCITLRRHSPRSGKGRGGRSCGGGRTSPNALDRTRIAPRTSRRKCRPTRSACGDPIVHIRPQPQFRYVNPRTRSTTGDPYDPWFSPPPRRAAN